MAFFLFGMESTKRLLWWMLAGSSGGLNRGRIILLLRVRPYNAHQIAIELGLDYKTVRHHIDVLVENNLLIFRGDGYGKMFFLSPELEAEFAVFEQIWAELGKKQIKPRPDDNVQGNAERQPRTDQAQDGVAKAGRPPAGKGNGPQGDIGSDGDR